MFSEMAKREVFALWELGTAKESRVDSPSTNQRPEADFCPVPPQWTVRYLEPSRPEKSRGPD